LVVSTTAFVGPISTAGAASVPLDGSGSAFHAAAIANWSNATQAAPYGLRVNYSASDSGDGRYEFAKSTTDFAATDIAYGLGSTDATVPSFPFIYVPITAGGIAFMYNVPGLTSTLQLSSYSACGILTGGITNWDSQIIANDNPGVTLPDLAIRPVTESDPSGVNYVLEQWCIHEQPALWNAFADNENSQAGGPTDGVAISATSANSEWPGIESGLDQQSMSGVAGNVSADLGAIGAVQVHYASDLGFGQGNPARGIASVLNASGKYTQPTPVDVASGLAYATQIANGTYHLDFDGVGANVYNPSTFSYLLIPTTGWSPTKGAEMSSFIDCVMSFGQQQSPTFGYASLGVSAEEYGIRAGGGRCARWRSTYLG
jgi:ABC-type phosphate transport system substrate-binding protein